MKVYLFSRFSVNHVSENILMCLHSLFLVTTQVEQGLLTICKSKFPIYCIFCNDFQSDKYIINNEVEILFLLLTLKNEQNYIGFSSF